AKILCHNLCCLVSSTYELELAVTFRGEDAAPEPFDVEAIEDAEPMPDMDELAAMLDWIGGTPCCSPRPPACSLPVPAVQPPALASMRHFKGGPIHETISSRRRRFGPRRCRHRRDGHETPSGRPERPIGVIRQPLAGLPGGDVPLREGRRRCA